jgi:hypothetical protein
MDSEWPNSLEKVAELVTRGAQNWRGETCAIEISPGGIPNGMNAQDAHRIRDSRVQPARSMTGTINLLARLEA